MWASGSKGGASVGYTSRCSVYLSGNQSINDTNPAKVEFDTAEYDEDLEFDLTTNNRFVAAEAGLYHVSAGSRISNCGNADLIHGSIYVNGSEVRKSEISPQDSAPVSNNISGDVWLEATEYIELWVYHNEIGVRPLESDPSITFMDIHRVQ